MGDVDKFVHFIRIDAVLTGSNCTPSQLKLLRLIVQQKSQILSRSDFVPSFLTSVLGPPGNSSVLLQYIDKRSFLNTTMFFLS